MNAYSADLADLPSKSDVAIAIHTAARLCGEDHRLVTGGQASIARHYAFRALVLAFPDLPHDRAAKLVHAYWPAQFREQNGRAENEPWWKDRILDAVLVALANAPQQRSAR